MVTDETRIEPHDEDTCCPTCSARLVIMADQLAELQRFVNDELRPMIESLSGAATALQGGGLATALGALFRNKQTPST